MDVHAAHLRPKTHLLRFQLGALAVAAFVAAGCSSDASSRDGTGLAQSEAEELPTLNTFITESVQIDELNDPPAPEDANLFLGDDPADSSASIDKPTGGPATFIDWHDLGSDIDNHRLLDEDLASGKDPTSFPRSNECVASSQVLSKMDLRYVASANNNDYAYFAVLRSNNNGDAGYYWLFTRKVPRLITGGGPCKATEEQLVYDITGPDENGEGGDVLLGGHFKPNDTPLITIYRATATQDGVPATDAINFDSALWAEDPAGAAAAAVNATVTAPGSFGTAGAGAVSDGNLEEELFAEAAVPISVFTGGSACGATFYGSVITRPSGSGGVNPDLKDLAGPALFNFGDVSAQATLTPTCGLEAGYSASAEGPDGAPLTGAECSWTFKQGETVTGTVTDSCSGTVALPAGTHTATVTVSDPVSGCSDTIDAAPVQVCPSLDVTAALSPTCTQSFGYDASPSGGCGNGVSYDWTFSGAGTVSPSTSSSKSGSVNVGTPAVSYGATVLATDSRSDITCTATDSTSTVPYAPLQVSLGLNGAALSCPSLSTDAVTYDAAPSGGNGDYSLSWIGQTCSGSSCTIDPSDSNFCASETVQVQVTDSSGLCSAATSEQETYEKVTTITASDN